MRQRGFLFLFALVALLAQGLAVAAELSGTVVLDPGRRGQGRTPLSETVVYFQPTHAAVVEPTQAVMSTRGKQFEPGLLIVPVGSTVEFPNADPILHNVFSVSTGNGFDAGLYGEGESHSQTFDEAGLVRVYCNVHQSMVGYVLVLDTPFVVRPDDDGRFVLQGLPAGGGRLSVWHERAAAPTTVEIEDLTEPVELSLVLDRPRVPKHLDKDGRSYRRRGGERYR